MKLRLVGDDLALQYFSINENTGQLLQRRAILTDPDSTKQYTVRTCCYNILKVAYGPKTIDLLLQVLVSATDQGLPDPCTSTRNATVNIRVSRNEHAPEFSDNGRYTRTIDEDADVMSVVTSVRANDRDDKVWSDCFGTVLLNFNKVSFNLFLATVQPIALRRDGCRSCSGVLQRERDERRSQTHQKLN